MYRPIILFTLLMLISCSSFAAWKQFPFIYYIDLPVVSQGQELTISAQYRLPRDVEQPVPAVIILHSSGGVDSTGQFYAKALNSAGIATLELDMWSGRGFAGGTSNRPQTVQETIPDALAALKFLAEQDEVDETKIATLGFSWGGVISMLTATSQYKPSNDFPYSFAAHIANYPVCWAYNLLPGFEFESLTGAPILIQAAELDDYDLPDTCLNLVGSLSEADKEFVSLNHYKNTYHAWDRLEPTLVVEDVFANLGQGGSVTLRPNFINALKSRSRVVKFLDDVFEQ